MLEVLDAELARADVLAAAARAAEAAVAALRQQLADEQLRGAAAPFPAVASTDEAETRAGASPRTDEALEPCPWLAAGAADCCGSDSRVEGAPLTRCRLAGATSLAAHPRFVYAAHHHPPPPCFSL